MLFNFANKSIGLTALATSTITLTCAIIYHKKSIQKLEKKLTEARLAERRGRIRAEVSLRSYLKEKDLNDDIETSNIETNGKKDSVEGGNDHRMIITSIGTLTTPFTKRMGTPRQGALVPASRAYLQLHPNLPVELLEGIEDYSHCWVIFEFHANTDVSLSKKSKIKPPRANKKVGMLATRSPHRPNPLGLTLVKVDRVDKKQKRLYMNAIDLVHGTPVYDIKPCVPWDIPGYSNQTETIGNTHLSVPTWVSQNDTIPTVTFTEKAKDDIRTLMSPPHNALAPLYVFTNYKSKKNKKKTNFNENDKYNNYEFEAVLETIKQVLAQDPRSSHIRGTATKMSYSFVFGKMKVDFEIENKNVVVVHGEVVDLENYLYVDGIPLLESKTQSFI